MYTIIPLAGPDFILKDGSLRPLYLVDGEHLLMKAIKSRFWYKNGQVADEKILFVLRDTPLTPDFIQFLKKHFQKSKVVVLSDLTQGALLSALAGTALITDFQAPICVDLVDILYDCDQSPLQCFSNDKNLYGVIPCFSSSNEKYSYLKIEKEEVIETVEKRVISSEASAGTYFFKNLPTFLEAIAYSLDHKDELAFKSNLFLCPSFNGLIANSKKVIPFPVKNVLSLSTLFST